MRRDSERAGLGSCGALNSSAKPCLFMPRLMQRGGGADGEAGAIFAGPVARDFPFHDPIHPRDRLNPSAG